MHKRCALSLSLSPPLHIIFLSVTVLRTTGKKSYINQYHVYIPLK